MPHCPTRRFPSGCPCGNEKNHRDVQPRWQCTCLRKSSWRGQSNLQWHRCADNQKCHTEIQSCSRRNSRDCTGFDHLRRDTYTYMYIHRNQQSRLYGACRQMLRHSWRYTAGRNRRCGRDFDMQHHRGLQTVPCRHSAASYSWCCQHSMPPVP